MNNRLPVQVIFREYFEGILAAVILALFLRFFVFSVLYIPSPNMEPNLLRGDFVIGWKLAYGLPVPLKEGYRLNAKVPLRGDVVAFRFPGDEEQLLTRRVIGLPGEKIKIVEGQIYINGKVAKYKDESGKTQEKWPSDVVYHIEKSLSSKMEDIEVPADNIFVLSDNRMRGDDSRTWGMVPISNIESRLAYIWLSIDGQDGGFKMRWSRLFLKIQ